MPDKIESPPWIEQINSALDAAESVVPEPDWLKGDEFPGWVKNVAAAALKGIFPETKAKDPKYWTAGDVGAFLGDKYAFWQWFFEEENYSPAFLRGLMKDIRKDKDLSLAKNAENKLLRQLLCMMISWLRMMWQTALPHFQTGLKNCLLIAADAPYHESVKFFKAYTKAIQRMPNASGAPARATTATSIYLYLLICWRSVEKLNSMAQLHQVLCNVFGSNTIGPVKRVEKMCERLHIKFAKPLKADAVPSNSDKPA